MPIEYLSTFFCKGNKKQKKEASELASYINPKVGITNKKCIKHF